MLISALNEYYDYLAKSNKVLPEGYSNVDIKYLIGLTPEGKIGEIIDYRIKEVITQKNGKEKEVLRPRKLVLPKRTEKTGIESNIIEHRPIYIFGLNYIKDNNSGDYLDDADKTGKAKKSHEAFVTVNLEFIKDMDSELINAYRNFLSNWKPESEKNNEMLISLGKELNASNYAFCLKGHPDRLLHEEKLIKNKWEKIYSDTSEEECIEEQCAITGEFDNIARLHSKIKGVVGGQASGTVLVGFNNDSDESYGNKQGANSCISKTVMTRYTEAMNYLLSDRKHKVVLDDMTIVFFAMSQSEEFEDQIQAMLFGESGGLSGEQLNDELRAIWESGKSGAITSERLENADNLAGEVDFYMFGLKPNASRLSLKFAHHCKFASVLINIARFQHDAQLSEKGFPISLNDIKRELISPKSTSENVNPALMTKTLEAIIMGYPLPNELFYTIVRRIKTDTNCKDKEGRSLLPPYRTKNRVGIIKAYLIRNMKEEIYMALDLENKNQAYLCGRLFAILEKLQMDASGGTLNRTIKDAYFSSACAKPAVIFPTLIKLAQNHLKKLKNPVYYNKAIGEVINELNNKFPSNLSLNEQGNFIIGYYQQNEKLYTKREEKQEDK